MRALVVHPGPFFSVADVHNGWVKALTKLGWDVREYDLHNRLQFYGSIEIHGQRAVPLDDVTNVASKGLLGKCYEFEPDLIIVVSGFFVPDFIFNLWKRKGTPVVLLCTESPYEDDKQCSLVERVQPDLVIVNDPVNLDYYRNIHDRTFYIPHSYDPDIHKPAKKPVKYERDFTFVGTGYPSRIEFFEQVDWTGINAQLAGNWGAIGTDAIVDTSALAPLIHDASVCIDNADAAKLYQKSKVSANLYRASSRADLEANQERFARGWAVGPREIELAATETFFLREERGEGDQLFPMLPTFSEPGEFAEKLRYFLTRAQVRRKAAAEARAAVHDRTFEAHARRMLRLLPDK